MKWVALIGFFALILPVTGYLKRNPLQSLKAWFLIGFLPFVVQYLHLYMAVDSAPDWAGYVKGAEVSLLDLIAVALFFATPGSKQPLPFRLVMAFYFFSVILSAFHALVPREALFYSWQLARMFILYATIVRGCANQKVTSAILTGMGYGILLEAVFALWQRFGMNLIQTGGTVGHQNLLGLMSHVVVLPFLAMLLAGWRRQFSIFVLIAGVLVIGSTASRGTVGIEAFGMVAVFLLSIARKRTPWKWRILMTSIIALAVVLPVVAKVFEERFTSDPVYEGDYDERAAYLKAAELMISDHPLGVGANHFTVMANIGLYDVKGGVQSDYSALAGNVHNFYYLTAAENGYPGLIALLLLMIRPLFVAFQCGWRSRGDNRGDLLLGLGVALLAVYLHSWVEWILATFAAQYSIAIAMGLVAGNAQQLGYWQPALLRKVFASSPTQSKLLAASSQSRIARNQSTL